MEGEKCDVSTDVAIEGPYPILFIPKVCTALQTNCELSENVFIHLNILSPDTDGNETVIYQGLCNVKVVDSDDINIRYRSPEHCPGGDSVPVILAEANELTFPFNDSQVWIDPVRSPYVYNRCDSPPAESYTIHESHDNHITIEQHNTYITQNVYNYNETIQYSPIVEEQKEIKKIQDNSQNGDRYDKYEDDEFECGVFLSQLSEEIINEKQLRAQGERKFIDLNTENGALKQLMSSDIQSVSRQQKTILFIGHDSQAGQTIQNIAINDPTLECVGAGEDWNDDDGEILMEDTDISEPRAKKYQCNKCKHIFDQLSAFKQHMVGSHQLSYVHDISKNVKFMCTECGKCLKSRKKFEQHCRGHGDPELECNKCHKVFASKFTLRNHRKMHSRMYPCTNCTKSFSKASEMHAHLAKAHSLYMCELCPFVCMSPSELKTHQEDHKESSSSKISSESNGEGTLEDISDLSSEDVKPVAAEPVVHQVVNQSADSVIAKVMSNDLFHDSPKKIKYQRKYNKTCEVCLKKFDRIGDLKRHLIEHVIRSTLAKNPVDKFGVLSMRCEICQEKVFTRIDRYKAHLREHAKLTIYKCTFCDKSFSDSSNFSKHKKIHGATFFQCDICQRKFNSKKMIAQHMEYHNKHGPIKCQYCDKVYHFKSTLNKHLKCAHNKETNNRVRCKFCCNYFGSLKDKWDHEWQVHCVRKVIVDCLYCDSRFRKYLELKKHCIEEHDTILPPAKKLLRWKLKRNMRLNAGK